MNYKFVLIASCCLWGSSMAAHAFNKESHVVVSVVQEEITITGQVVSENGELLSSATVTSLSVSGRTTQTDATGRFSLSVPNGSKISVRYIGYAAKEVDINGVGPYRVMLMSDQTTLDEVVVVGYGTQSKDEFTGSAARIGGDKVKDMPVQSFDQAMVGQAAGVNIAVPNGLLNNAPVIRIRGTNSISLSSYPLIVIDGVPVSSGDVSSSANVTNNPLADINPADIESIDVLKDAASTAIYGSRAAGGVLLVTTKRGKEGKARFTYDGWVGMTNAVRLPKLLDAQGFMDIKNEAVLNAKLLSGNAAAADALYFPMYDGQGNLINTNWYDEVYQTGMSHSNALTVSGGSAATSYFFSVNHSNQEGMVKTNNFGRSGVRFNLDHQVAPWLKVRGSGSYSNSKNQSPNSGSTPGQAQSTAGIARMVQALYPNVPARNEDGTPYINTAVPEGSIGNGNNNVHSVLYNPIALFDLAKYTSENDRILANIGATVNIIEGLDFTTNYAMDRLNVLNVNSISAVQGSGSSTNGSVTNVHSLRKNWNFTNTLNFSKKFDNHSFSVLVGSDIQEFDNSRWGANVTQASDPYFIDFQGNWGNIVPSGANNLTSSSFLSYFTRLTYSLANKYHMTINYRRDGNSALGFDRKWGDFGGISAGWHLSEEGFYKNSNFAEIVNSLKFRASWGRVGNGNMNNPYSSLDLYSSSLYGSAATFEISQAGNPMLGWETSDQTNIGLDFALLNNRLQGEITYFHNNVNGLILSVPQAPSKGIPGNSILSNVGSLFNKGIEFAIGGGIITNEKFRWNSNFNFTYIKNEVTTLAGDGDRILGTTSQAANIFNVTQVGLQVGTLFGAVTEGVNPENGRRIFVNKEGERVQYSHVVGAGDSRWSYLDGRPAEAITADDYQPLGNALPTYYGGFNNTLSYGNVDLGINLSFSGGNYILNGNTGTQLDQRFFNNSVKVLDRWTTPGQVTDVPRLVYNEPFASANIPNISDYVEKGDFVRLQLVSLGYRLPSTVFGSSGIQSARIYAQVNNAYLFTKYTGLEPESSVNGNSNTSPGIEYNSLGGGRTFTFGLNIGF